MDFNDYVIYVVFIMLILEVLDHTKLSSLCVGQFYCTTSTSLILACLGLEIALHDATFLLKKKMDVFFFFIFKLLFGHETAN